MKLLFVWCTLLILNVHERVLVTTCYLSIAIRILKWDKGFIYLSDLLPVTSYLVLNLMRMAEDGGRWTKVENTSWRPQRSCFWFYLCCNIEKRRIFARVFIFFHVFLGILCQFTFLKIHLRWISGVFEKI